MPHARGWLEWAALVVAVTAIDLGVRFAIPFDLTRVLAVETVLFLATALTMAWMVSRAPANRKWLRVLQWVVAWSFGLAAVRSGIWASGQPVLRANVTTCALGAAVLVIAWVRRRRRTEGPPGAEHRPGE